MLAAAELAARAARRLQIPRHVAFVSRSAPLILPRQEPPSRRLPLHEAAFSSSSAPSGGSSAGPPLPRCTGGGGPPGQAQGGERCPPPGGLPFEVKGLNHIAVVVPDLERAAEHYRAVLGAIVTEPKDLPEHGVTFVVARLNNLHLELLHPLGADSPVANFLAKNPLGGLHHVCLTVDTVEGAAAYMKERGVRLLGGGIPRLGAHHNPVVFAHPKDFGGVLYELEEEAALQPEEAVDSDRAADR